LARTLTRQLRALIRSSPYPHVLDHAGLDGAVSELARRASERGGFRTSVEVQPDAAGLDDASAPGAGTNASARIPIAA